MSPEDIGSVFEHFLASRKDLTENEKELLDFMKKLLFKIRRFMTLSVTKDLNPIVFMHVADHIFPEITLRFCYDVITVHCGKNHAFDITLKDVETVPIDVFIQKIRWLMARG